MSEPATVKHSDMPMPGSMLSTKRAVIYLRVSTAKQAAKDTDVEGYSLPAQRDACMRKAAELGAEVVDEYLDRGESAKTTDRPEFQRMLTRIRLARDVDYVILDKIDRFARNRRDDANTLFELKSYGAQLVSVKENIDETPAGQLLHAIMAGIAEFYSRNLATEALKGMTQKAKTGGTPGKAPVGYLNTRQRIEGREVRVVAVDPDRAPHIQWAFEAYASGEYTIRSLAEALAARGVASERGARRGYALSKSHVARLLTNRYYLGYVTFKGAEYMGKHQPLVTQGIFVRCPTSSG
jgi:site-specific DNA recombinase